MTAALKQCALLHSIPEISFIHSKISNPQKQCSQTSDCQYILEITVIQMSLQIIMSKPGDKGRHHFRPEALH